MDELRFYAPFNGFSVISRRSVDDNESPFGTPLAIEKVPAFSGS